MLTNCAVLVSILWAGGGRDLALQRHRPWECPATLTDYSEALQQNKGQIQKESVTTYKPWLCPLNSNMEFAEPR